MENKTNKFLIVISSVLLVVVIFLGVLFFKYYPEVFKSTTGNNNQESSQGNSNNESSSTDNSSTTQPQSFDNQYMSVLIPEGWQYTATSTGALNISKDNYVLYINPNFNQASGVNGARFAEVSMGSPSADLVMKVQPSDPCGTSETTGIFLNYTRNDWYVSKSNASEVCDTPSSVSSKWYFSYVNTGNGYVNYYNESDPVDSYVITMSYDTANINNLPDKGSATLDDMLTQMTNILKTLKLKH